MTKVDPQYQEVAKQISYNVANKVLPMDKLPETLLEAYEGLFTELMLRKKLLTVRTLKKR